MLKKYISLLLLLFVVHKFYLLFFLAESDFLTTISVYIVITFVLYFITHYFNLSENGKLIFYSICSALFFAEFMLRFIIQFPLTYPEQGGGCYKSQYYVDELEGREDMHTMEFDPYQYRQYDSPEFNYPSETLNQLGFRGTAPVNGNRIILALGDSFTEGLGAPSDSTYPILLTRLIQQNNSCSMVFNAGTAGNDPFFDFKMLHKLHNQISFKKVLFLVNTSDVNDVSIRGGDERFQEDGGLKYMLPPWWEFVYATSFVFRLATHNLFNIDYNLRTSDKTDLINQESILKIRDLFKNKILPWSEKHALQISVVIHPMQSELNQNQRIYINLSESLSEIDGIEFYDLREDLNNLVENPQEIYWPIDGHFKPKGYAILAKGIFENVFLVDSLEHSNN